MPKRARGADQQIAEKQSATSNIRIVSSVIALLTPRNTSRCAMRQTQETHAARHEQDDAGDAHERARRR
jgi:hypothetical protein